MGRLFALVADHVLGTVPDGLKDDLSTAIRTTKVSQTLGKPAHHSPSKCSQGNQSQEDALPGKCPIPPNYRKRSREQRDEKIGPREMTATDEFADSLRLLLEFSCWH